MTKEPQELMTAAEIKAYLEAHTRPRQFGPHYQDLVEVVDGNCALSRLSASSGRLARLLTSYGRLPR
jgi:hypothetical protein